MRKHGRAKPHIGTGRFSRTRALRGTAGSVLRNQGIENGPGVCVQALERVRAERPDLAILDVMMPNRNGFEVCQDLRQDPEFKTMRIMMLTAKGRDTEVSKGLALGADVYMTKPFATRDLLAKVKALLERA